LGLITVWTILKSNSLLEKWSDTLWDVTKKDALKTAVEEALKKVYDDDEDEEMVKEKKLTESVLADLLEYDIKKRKTPA